MDVLKTKLDIYRYITDWSDCICVVAALQCRPGLASLLLPCRTGETGRYAIQILRLHLLSVVQASSGYVRRVEVLHNQQIYEPRGKVVGSMGTRPTKSAVK